MKKIDSFRGLPFKYESFLIEKYDSFMTTCRYLEIHYKNHEFHYLLVYQDDKLEELLLFGNNGDTATCFNSLVEIEATILEMCMLELFFNYPQIAKIRLIALYTEYERKKAVLYSRSDDHILKLPSDMDEYMEALGSSTRQHLRSHKAKLLRDYPDARFIAKFGDEIDEQIVDKIVELKRIRMREKGKPPGIDYTYKHNMYHYCRHYGCVTYIEVDGEIIAGSINTMMNKHAFGHVTAFHPRFSKYSVGEMCAFYLIQVAIERGQKKLHFLWGASDLKKRLLAEPSMLFSYIVYKDYTADYYISKAKIKVIDMMLRLKESRFTLPLRHVIAVYRKNYWKLNLMSMLLSGISLIDDVPAT